MLWFNHGGSQATQGAEIRVGRGIDVRSLACVCSDDLVRRVGQWEVGWSSSSARARLRRQASRRRTFNTARLGKREANWTKSQSK